MVRLWRFTCDLAGRCTEIRYAFGRDGAFFETRRQILLELEDIETTVDVDYYRKGQWRPFDRFILKEERMMRSVTTMAICLSDDLAAWIRDQAEREGLSISAYVRQILMRERRLWDPEVGSDETE